MGYEFFKEKICFLPPRSRVLIMTSPLHMAYVACFWLNHLTLISDMSEARILAYSFDWTIAICSIKELL